MQESAWHHAGLDSRLQNQATAESPPQHPAIEPDEYSGLAASRVLPVPVVQVAGGGELRKEVYCFEGGAPVLDEDANAAADAGCQHKTAQSWGMRVGESMETTHRLKFP